MRFYLSADIEGICGVVSREHTRPGGFEYERARDWMTQSVLAVCEVARDHGADEIVVSDSHGNGLNIRLEAMPDYTCLVRSWPRPLGMMQGIERGRFDGAFLVGYHARGSNCNGVLSHTMSSEFFHELRLNGQSASEASISAAIAGAYAVPVLMVAGDDVAVTEAQTLLGDLSTATLMEAISTTSALCPAPGVALERLRTATKAAIARVGDAEPMRVEGPIAFDMVMRTRAVAEWLAYLPQVERLDAYTVRYQAEDIVALSRFLMFVTLARQTLTA